MVEREVVVKIPCGMHIRPAGILSYEASRYRSRAHIIFKHHTINVHSLLNIVAGGIKCGDTVLVRCSGDDENEMLEAIVHILQREDITE